MGVMGIMRLNESIVCKQPLLSLNRNVPKFPKPLFISLQFPSPPFPPKPSLAPQDSNGHSS